MKSVLGACVKSKWKGVMFRRNNSSDDANDDGELDI
tara:strand:+ start:606 stop:713 length:108 start_codon:yes stop_codon:yes gene_type:complete